ncbi:hypothetical protein [Clostridium sp. HBUAS56010]|uniref:hypothetical protein n=1 Tax=Clostridium sp. HBUAS56010 TaxID=2571127 RepID=UPI00117734E0|nr:hypothetical protein [Clostridium sp. HBUAS56010]
MKIKTVLCLVQLISLGLLDCSIIVNGASLRQKVIALVLHIPAAILANKTIREMEAEIKQRREEK